MKFYQLIFLALISFSFSSCVDLNQMQKDKTIKDGIDSAY